MAGHVLVVGAGQAGFQLAASLRQKGFDGDITLIGDETAPPYQRPPLSKAYLDDGREERLHLRGAAFYDDNRISLMTGRRVVAIDRAARQVRLDDDSLVSWDRLVLATGTRVARPPVAGLDLPGVHVLRSLEDAQRLRAAMTGMRRTVVIGGGFIGLEFAAVARKAGIEVTVVEGGSRLMARAVSPEMSAIFHRFHSESGASILLNSLAGSVDAGMNGEITGVTLVDGRFLPADSVILAAGVVPNTELAASAGLEVCNGILTDPLMTTADPQIHAIGDCAAFPDPFGTSHIRLESVQAAIDHARCLADAILGQPSPYAALPWFWSDQGRLKLQIAGLAAHDDGALLSQTEKGGQVVLRLRRDQITAVETVNAAAVHMAARKQLAAGPIPLGAFALPARPAA